MVRGAVALWGGNSLVVRLVVVLLTGNFLVARLFVALLSDNFLIVKCSRRTDFRGSPEVMPFFSSMHLLESASVVVLSENVVFF